MATARVFAAGALLLGGPALALLAPHSVAAIVAVSIARGIGFGLNTVVTGRPGGHGAAAGAARRGDRPGRSRGLRARDRGAAIRGLAGRRTPGTRVVIVITAASALAPLAAVPWLAGPADRRAEAEPGADQTARPAGQPAVRRPAAAVPRLRGHDRGGGRGRRVPAAHGRGVRRRRRARVARAGRGRGTEPLVGRAPRRPARSRRAAGSRAGDRHRRDDLLIWVAAPAALITGMCLFGTGFGISQNATFTLMIDRTPASGYGTASALWNLAYDAGYGAGPAVFGMFVGPHRLPGGLRPHRNADARRARARRA